MVTLAIVLAREIRELSVYINGFAAAILRELH